MGSVAFGGEDESQPSTSNSKSYHLPRTLLDECSAVNHASIPRKLRSAIKKRGRESVTSPLLISGKQQHHVTSTVDKLRKYGAKKCKVNMKKGRVTKDEVEVAETLYALAGMFSIANKADQQNLEDNEKPDLRSSATLEEGISSNAAKDTYLILQGEMRKIGSETTPGGIYSSTSVNSTAEEIISQATEARPPELFSTNQATTPNDFGDLSDISPVSTSRPLISTLGMNQSGEHEIHLDQNAGSEFQYGKSYSSMVDKHKGTICSSQPRVVEKKITTKKCTGVITESNKSWKRCSAHIYISRLTKTLQISDGKNGFPSTPTQPTTCHGAELQSRVRRINGGKCDMFDVVAAKQDSSEIQSGVLLHKRPIQDEQTYNFLSMGTGENANGAGCFLEPLKQYHMVYAQSQNQSSPFSSLPPNGYSLSLHSHNSASAAQQQVHLSQYHSSIVNGNFTSQTRQRQQHTYYNGNAGVDNSASVHNYTHSLFPHLHAVPGSKYQQLSPSQLLMNTSLMPLANTKKRHNLPLGFVDVNGAMFNPQLHLPCNQNL